MAPLGTCPTIEVVVVAAEFGLRHGIGKCDMERCVMVLRWGRSARRALQGSGHKMEGFERERWVRHGKRGMVGLVGMVGTGELKEEVEVGVRGGESSQESGTRDELVVVGAGLSKNETSSLGVRLGPSAEVRSRYVIVELPVASSSSESSRKRVWSPRSVTPKK